MFFTELTLLVLAVVPSVIAQTSLYVPGFDSQPLSVDVIGAADGVTTYQIAVGTSSGTLDDLGTATLIEGANSVKLIYGDDSLGATVTEDCVIVDGIATCTLAAVIMASTITEIVTETAASFDVQLGLTVSPTDDNQNTAATSTPSAGSSVSPVPTQTAVSSSSGMSSVSTKASASTSSSATGTQTANGAIKREAASLVLFATLLGLGLLLFLKF